MPTLNVPQAKLLALPHKFCGLVVGFGFGKTWVSRPGLAQYAWEWPHINADYFAPTYAQIHDVFYPTMGKVAFDRGLRTKIDQANHEVHFYSGSAYRMTTICRFMERPQTIVGSKVGRALSDEIDALPAQKVQQAWRKIVVRTRYKVDDLRNCVDVATIPGGFKFVFQQPAKQLRGKPHLQDPHGLVQANTYDNEVNLPDDYIDSLTEPYPPQLIAAYLRGQFVNLTSGTIYTAYDRTLSASRETVQPGEPIFVGMDFNVGKMAAVVHVKRLGLPHVVDEIANGYDTLGAIRQIKEQFWLYADGEYRPTCQTRIYPDTSGDSRKSVRANETDIVLLKQAGFVASAPTTNPSVKGRINFMNAVFCNAEGEWRYRVNPDRCPIYADTLEQQVWDINGEPGKLSDIDYPNDAGGYFIHKEYPTTEYSLAGVS